MKTFLYMCGAWFIALGLLGSMGIGHFQLNYGPDKLECRKATP